LRFNGLVRLSTCNPQPQSLEFKTLQRGCEIERLFQLRQQNGLLRTRVILLSTVHPAATRNGKEWSVVMVMVTSMTVIVITRREIRFGPPRQAR